jgi:hypothetical protein
MLYLQSVDERINDAAIDFKYLIERGYTRNAALKIVANRYGLDRDGQMAIYRSIYPQHVSHSIFRKKVGRNDIRGMKLAIDWYNVLITVDSGVHSGALYLGTDGFIRDIRGIHGKIGLLRDIVDTISSITAFLSKVKPRELVIYLEKNISRSGEMAKILPEIFSRFDLSIDRIALTKTVDKELISEKEIVATSDSVILGKVGRAIDLASEVLDSLEKEVKAYYFPLD